MKLEGGIKVQAISKYNAKIPDQVKGEHLWILASVYRVTPHQDEYLLDMENLISIDGPGCFWCEELWSPEIAAKPCVLK